MKKIKVVIGANFGDEGKGLMTDYFCTQFDSDVLNVRYNATCQAGHTVVKDKKRHIFSHFGAGSFNSNVTTFLSSYFFTNPILFNKEYDELVSKGVTPKVCISENSSLILLYDILYNRMIEIMRSTNRHGSCGMGLWESVLRNRDNFTFYIKELKCEDYKLFKKIKTIRDLYYAEKAKKEGVNLNSGTIVDAIEWLDDSVIDKYIEECRIMLSRIEIVKDIEIFKNFDNIVFEGAQGLLLDWGNREYMPNLTASYTGLLNVNSLISLIDEIKDIEVCYITRSYFTRHGAGKFESEVENKYILGINAIDKTNNLNPWQGNFRYGYFDMQLFVKNILKDLKLLEYTKLVSVCVTHLDETDNKLKLELGDESISYIHNEIPEVVKIYISKSEDSKNMQSVSY